MYFVRISIGFVLLLGAAFAALMLFYAAAPFTESGVIPFSHSAAGDAIIFGFLTICSLLICIGLIKRKSWAWWTTVLFCILLVLAGFGLLWITMHPRDEFARSEGGFGWFLSFILLLIGGICLSILSSRSVRKSFISRDSHN